MTLHQARARLASAWASYADTPADEREAVEGLRAACDDLIAVLDGTPEMERPNQCSNPSHGACCWGRL